MCIICQKQDDFSFGHMEVEIKKIRRDDLATKAKQIKDSLVQQERWLLGNCDGYERKAVEDTIQYLKSAQYLLSRYM